MAYMIGVYDTLITKTINKCEQIIVMNRQIYLQM